jgi:hypothetical protein
MKRSIGKILRPFCRKNGICVHCFRRWATHGARCENCYESDLAFQRQRYKRRKKAGLCVKCGKRPAQDTNLRCVDCEQKNQDRKTRARKRKLTDRRV